MLSRLQQLTYLCVTDCSECIFTPAAMHLTALTGLLHFGLNELPPLAGPLDWLLPLTQLTALELTRQQGSIPPVFAALPKLRRLCLSWSRIDPAALAAVSGLQHLQLYSCDLDCASDGEQQQRSQAEGAFLGWLQLQPLTHLSINNGCYWLHDNGAAACAAVAASTALRELQYPWLFQQLPAQQQLCCSLTALDVLLQQ